MSTRQLNNFFDGWLRIYEGTDLPKKFAYWAGIFTIASVLQDNVYLKEGKSVLKPNLYLWFLGLGGTGKSESATPAIDLLKMIPFIETYEGFLTSLFLFKHLQNVQQKQVIHLPHIKNPRLTIYSDELADSLGSGPLAEQFMKALTVMYNRSYRYGTDKHKDIEINDPVLNWLACCTPSWLRRAVPKDMLDSGFVARIISVYEPLGNRRKYGVSDDPKLWQSLVNDLIHISLLKGEFKLTKDAQKIRDNWGQKQWDARLLMDELTQGIYGREEEHTLKVAMCLSAAGSDSLTITERGFVNAAKLVLDARESSIDVLKSIAMTPQIELKMYLYRYIQNNAPIAHSLVRQRTYHKIADNAEFYRYINALSQEGLIRIGTTQSGKGVVYELPSVATSSGGNTTTTIPTNNQVDS